MYNLYRVKDITKPDSTIQVNGEYVPMRSVRYPCLWNDIKLAWLVLTRRADAIVWPQDENKTDAYLNNSFMTKIPLDEDNRMVRMGFGKHQGQLFFRIDLWYNGFRFTR